MYKNILIGKTWHIPEDAQKPERANKKNDTPTLLQILREQKAAKMTGGIYHNVQIDQTYNSNHIEGSRLTHDQTRYIFETNLKLFYYRGLKEWDHEKGFLLDTCLSVQDRFKGYLDYFRIAY